MPPPVSPSPGMWVPPSVVLNPADTAWGSFRGVTQAGALAPCTPAFWLVLYGACFQQAGGGRATGGSSAGRVRGVGRPRGAAV